MFACDCYCWGNGYEELAPLRSKPFSLPAPLPKWSQGQGFATGRICLGEILVVKISEFERIWSCDRSWGTSQPISFYRPINVPDGFFCLGHYSQTDDKDLRGYVLVAREVESINCNDNTNCKLASDSPALAMPLSYKLIWSSNSRNDGHGYIWLPDAPVGYKSMGFLVTNKPDQPSIDEVRCVRDDLTVRCETYDLLFSRGSFEIWKTRPSQRGMCCAGVSVGTFFCSEASWSLIYGKESGNPTEFNIACLKNLDSTLNAMPNLDQIHELIKHYGPTVFFHPDDEYLPSSVSWFFKNGALLYKDGEDKGISIDPSGSNLPGGGINDGKFWLDLPVDAENRKYVKYGNIESGELYVHVKPALGGSFTDIAMWIFCPFNGPVTLKAGWKNIALDKIGEHVSDWEHYTLRISNFDGELWSLYFSEHSGGGWKDASEIEFIEGTNRPIVYSSKHGHACFPRPGCYIQGLSTLGLGVRNDCAESKHLIDSSIRYQIVAAEYLGEGAVKEPPWLQYMREWGPTVVYDSRTEVEKLISHLPFFVRFTVESLFGLFPTELYGEEGPTGPKEKDNWLGDER